MRKIPVTIVTGFVGAGKTSLIRHLIEHADGRRLALVINEFGELGIDRELLLGCGVKGCSAEDVVELANGCICCTVADDFLPTLQALLDRAEPPDHIVIETSGLALPQPLVQAFNWPEVKSRVTVDGVVVVIDAAAGATGRFADDPGALAAQRTADPALDHDNPLEEVVADQLACADLVNLNKSDLLDRAGEGAVAGRSGGWRAPPALFRPPLGIGRAAREPPRRHRPQGSRSGGDRRGIASLTEGTREHAREAELLQSGAGRGQGAAPEGCLSHDQRARSWAAPPGLSARLADQ